LKLEIALNELHLNIKSDEMWLWGKIIGLEKDYFIAVAINFVDKYQFPEKKFFWCSSNNFQFAPMNDPEEYHLKECQKFNTYFTGNQETILVTLAKDEEAQPDQANEKKEELKKEEDPDISREEIVEVVKLKNFTELDRLGFLVRMIDRETAVVPEGAFKMLPIHEMRRNDNFQGLKSNEIGNLSKYMHFRDVMSQEKREFIQRDDAIFSFNFLDQIDKDTVKGSWSLQLDSTKTLVFNT
jgi:radial spoke head protein 9